MSGAQMQKELQTMEIRSAQEKKTATDAFIEKYGKQIEQSLKNGEISSDQIVSLGLSLAAKHGPDALKEALARMGALQQKTNTTISKVFEPLVFWGDYSKSKVEYEKDGVKIVYSNSLKSWAPEKVTFEATASGGSLRFDWKFGEPKAKRI
jgi:hypothetical protein